MKKDMTTIVIAALLYSLMGFGYMHSTFIDKDYMKLVLDRLTSIESKLSGEGK